MLCVIECACYVIYSNNGVTLKSGLGGHSGTLKVAPFAKSLNITQGHLKSHSQYFIVHVSMWYTF